MHDATAFLTALAAVLGVAAVTTVVFKRLRAPVVLGYVLAGFIIGPHVPIPIVADHALVNTLSELGVIMLMFGLGLEFSLARLFHAAPTAGVTALVQSSLLVWLGYVAARALGWSDDECLFAGAMIASSSTTIIAKAFDELRIKGSLRDFVVAILIVEDLIAVILMAVLTAVASGRGLSAGEVAATVGKLTAFLVGFVALGLLLVPRFIRSLVAQKNDETLGISTLAICFGSALLAHFFGYSVALGAFVGGMLVAESGSAHHIEALVRPVRDLFAAVFFVSVGMMIDPATIAQHWVAIIVFTLLVLVGKLVGVSIGGVLTGTSVKTSVAAGLSLSQIGEFAFIIASLGMALKVIGTHLYAVAVAASAITTLTTPWLLRVSSRAGEWTERHLPRPLQTFVVLYGNWLERVRAARHESKSLLWKLARSVAIDLVAVAAIFIGVASSQLFLAGQLQARVDLSATASRAVVLGAAGVLAAPFCVGLLRNTRRLARTMAETVIPPPRTAKGVDLGRAPRRMLQGAVELTGVLVVGLPLVALTQPFIGGFGAAALLLVVLMVVGFFFWRTADDLHGHVGAVSEALLGVLASQTAPAAPTHEEAPPTELFPGLGPVTQLRLAEGSTALGQSLTQLSLRSRTGASVLALVREGQGVTAPDAKEPLRAGDVLALVGSGEAVAAAKALLGPAPG